MILFNIIYPQNTDFWQKVLMLTNTQSCRVSLQNKMPTEDVDGPLLSPLEARFWLIDVFQSTRGIQKLM